jgi:predicted RNA-binding protein YlqC (UPF0109 family)
MKEEISDILVKFTEDILDYVIGDINIRKEVTVSPTTKKVIVYIDVPKEQRGRIIGKSGMTIEAIKVLAIGIKNSRFPDDKRKVEIEVVEPENFLAQK